MHVTLRVIALPVLLVGACGDEPVPGPGTPGDTVGPALVALRPAPGDTGVRLLSQVEVTLSEPVNPATLGPASFFLLRGTVPVAASYAVESLTVALQPDSSLDSLTTYTVTITRAVRDPAGNRLAADTTWSFRTGAGVVPAGRRAGPCGPPGCLPR
jgi:hypothetical protein